MNLINYIARSKKVKSKTMHKDDLLSFLEKVSDKPYIAKFIDWVPNKGPYEPNEATNLGLDQIRDYLESTSHNSSGKVSEYSLPQGKNRIFVKMDKDNSPFKIDLDIFYKCPEK